MQTSGLRRLRRALAALCVLLAAIAGAAAYAMRPRALQLANSEGGAATMPDVVMTDVDRSGRKFIDAGFAVQVRRPASTFTPKGASSPLTLPEIQKSFAPGEWSHLVADQVPKVGTMLAPGTTIVLVIGVHHGAGPFRPWIEAHGTAVSVRGDGRCRECHAPSYCSDCHDRWQKR